MKNKTLKRKVLKQTGGSSPLPPRIKAHGREADDGLV